MQAWNWSGWWRIENGPWQDRRIHILHYCSFKVINDTLGHITGDILLQLVTQRMRGCVRESDTVARIGGDEFAVLLLTIQSRQDALTVAEKLRTELEAPFKVNGKRLNIPCAVGAAFYPDDGSDGETLTRNADQAMYLAKKTGRNRVCFRDMPR